MKSIGALVLMMTSVLAGTATAADGQAEVQRRRADLAVICAENARWTPRQKVAGILGTAGFTAAMPRVRGLDELRAVMILSGASVVVAGLGGLATVIFDDFYARSAADSALTTPFEFLMFMRSRETKQLARLAGDANLDRSVEELANRMRAKRTQLNSIQLEGVYR